MTSSCYRPAWENAPWQRFLLDQQSTHAASPRPCLARPNSWFGPSCRKVGTDERLSPPSRNAKRKLTVHWLRNDALIWAASLSNLEITSKFSSKTVIPCWLRPYLLWLAALYFRKIMNGRLLLRSPADGFSILSAAFSRAKSCSPLCNTQLSPSFHKHSQDIHAYKMRKQSSRSINNYTLHLLIKFDRLTLVTRERD